MLGEAKWTRFESILTVLTPIGLQFSQLDLFLVRLIGTMINHRSNEGIDDIAACRTRSRWFFLSGIVVRDFIVFILPFLGLPRVREKSEERA